MVVTNDIMLIDLQPEFLRNDRRTIALCNAIEPMLKLLLQTVRAQLLYTNIDELDGEALDDIAWGLDCFWYNPNDTLEVRRATVKAAMRIFAQLGSVAAIEDAATIIFGNAEVQEWYTYGGEPYRFRVLSSNKFATPEDARRFKALLSSLKTSRAVLDDILILKTWREIRDIHYLTWQGTLGLHYWTDLRQTAWLMAFDSKWSALLGDNTWGNVYSYIWEDGT